MSADVQKLIKTIHETENAVEKREAIIALGYEDHADIYPLLIEQLKDENTGIQHAAVISLGRIGNAHAIEELIKPKILRSHSVDIRWAAVTAIGELGDHRAIDHLMRAVDDEEWIVRNQAATELKTKILDIIKKRDVQTARILIRLLDLEYPEIVELSIDGLTKMGLKTSDALMECLKSPSPLVRMNAATALGRMVAVRALFPLIDLLADSDWRVRKSAIAALSALGKKRAVEFIVRCLSDNVEAVQQQAMEALTTFRYAATEPLLKALVHERNKFVQRAIILTLGDIGDESSIPTLIRFLRSSYFVIRNAVVRALVRFGPTIIEPLREILSFNKSDIQSLLKKAQPNDDYFEQIRAIRALGALEDHRAVNVLKDLSEKGNLEVAECAEKALVQIGTAAWGRCGALNVLGELGDHCVLPDFINSLEDDSANVRLEAVRGLGKLGGEKAIDALMQVVCSDKDPYIRSEAMALLRQVGVGFEKVLDTALKGLKDSDPSVRMHAAALLGNFQDKRSIPPLLEAMTDSHWSVRESAENALQNFASDSVPQLLDALESESWTLRFRAIRLLGEVADEKVIPKLEALVSKKDEHPRVKEFATETVQKLKKK